ncbi:MAG: primosomal protein N' [Polyangiaceae bacterium]|nr:primosomal protein N' [Polyangiaceae bacterium]
MDYVKVAVPVPLGRSFSYAVPTELEGTAVPGCRVLCDFGRRRVLGVVIDRGPTAPADVPLEKIKPLRAVVDAHPVLPMDLLSFLLQLSRYYFSPVGDVVRLALPSVARSAKIVLADQGLLDNTKLKTVGRMVQVAELTGNELPELKGQAVAVVAKLASDGPQLVSNLQSLHKNARSVLKSLESRGVVRILKKERRRGRFFCAPAIRDQAPSLNAAQREATESINAALDEKKSEHFLLHGVTASGKTEVYLHSVQHCLNQGRSAMVLVPEIALTPQLVSRFRARLGDEIAVMHSGLTEGDRFEMWTRLRGGELRVVVGARSALFAPMVELGLICVDEEHDGSFKQEEGVRYHARDMALLRAHRSGAVCVLGSATPSLSTEARVRGGKVTRLSLPERAHRASSMPTVELVDMRRMGPGPAGDKLLSLPLCRKLEAVLAAGEQAILFLNRRGFAPAVVCESCGQLAECPNCSVALTHHKIAGGQLSCHYCDYTIRMPSECGKCGGKSLGLEGAGTERVEDQLAKLYPEARIARLDRDVAAGLKSEKILDRMRAGEVDILVGTQMVTKGHDLPKVTLVGVLNADTALSLPDFQAAERTFQLLVQVSGRAGRAEDPGVVMIQTRNPEHPAVAMAATHNLAGFVKQELRDRKELRYPPYAFLALVRIDGPLEHEVEAFAARLAAVAQKNVITGVDILGPAPAPLARLRGRYRYRFMFRATARKALREAILPIVRAEVPRKLRVSVDVDPVSML